MTDEKLLLSRKTDKYELTVTNLSNAELRQAETVTQFYNVFTYTKLSIRMSVITQYFDVEVSDKFTLQLKSFEEKMINTGGMLTDSYIEVSSRYDDDGQLLNVTIPLCDMWAGQVYVQFYDDPNKKNAIMEPVIVSFDTVPSIQYITMQRTSDASGIDNVLHETAGFNNNGRVDLLAEASRSEYYNDVFAENKLITNGLLSTSVNGHPVYEAYIVTQIPVKFAETFAEGDADEVKFELTNQASLVSNDGSTIAYNTEYAKTTSSKISRICILEYNKSEIESTSVDLIQQVWHFPLSKDAFAVSVTDKDFRNCTTFLAEFKLAGLSSDWTN